VFLRWLGHSHDARPQAPVQKKQIPFYQYFDVLVDKEKKKDAKSAFRCVPTKTTPAPFGGEAHTHTAA